MEEEDNNDKYEDEDKEEHSCVTVVTIEEDECLTVAATVETPPLRMEIHQHCNRLCLAWSPPTLAVLKLMVLDTH